MDVYEYVISTAHENTVVEAPGLRGANKKEMSTSVMTIKNIKLGPTNQTKCCYTIHSKVNIWSGEKSYSSIFSTYH
jgi:hypothetical protein